MADYFAHLLMLNSREAHVVIQMALKVGQLVAMYFKNEFNRPRPQQVNPELFPLIPPPQHPSFPSAHSLESHLIAMALTEVMPGAAKLLDQLARRMAENREMAGVHYRSDTTAGEELAKAVFPRLMKCKSFAKAVVLAREQLAKDQPKGVQPWT